MGRTDNPHLVYMRYRFPKGARDGKGRQLESIVLREVCEPDEEVAGKIVAGDPKMKFHVALFQESVVALRYVGGDDVEVDAPDPDRLGGWPTKTRDYAMRMFVRLNGVTDEEDAKGAEEAKPEDPKRPRAQ
jgi:hypothetical protein